MYGKNELKSSNIKNLVDYLNLNFNTVFDKKDIYNLSYFLKGFLAAKIQLQKSEKHIYIFIFIFRDGFQINFNQRLNTILRG